MSALRSLSDDLTRLVRESSPCLVRVRGARRPATATVWRAGDDGATLAVLAAHVLGARDEGTVELGGRPVAARVLGRAPGLDLALLGLDAEPPPALARRTEDEALAVGELVVSLGHPGPRTRAALGMISGLGGAWRPFRGGRRHPGVEAAETGRSSIDALIDVDGALPAGFSGGPLLDAEGRLVGINTHGLVRGGTTLPWATVDRAVARLLARGGGPMGYLGVAVQRVRLQEARAATAGRDAGLLVTALVEGGPGQRGGLVVGDVLLSVAGEAVESVGDLFEALAGRGETEVEVAALRGETLHTARVPVGVRPSRGRARRASRAG